MKNKKGFTLVELLAVIVVLAIIMIIAVPSVLNSMTDARRNSFVVYAEKLINSAQAQSQATQMVNGTPQSCYELSDLIDGATGAYKGYVTYTKGTDTDPEAEVYHVYLRDNNYATQKITAQQLETEKTDKSNLVDELTDAKIAVYDADSMASANNNWKCPTTTPAS